MFSPPDHARNLSLRLSAVLDDIGVNEIMVMKRRRMWMLHEAMQNIHLQMNANNWSLFHFGSQTEGSTTEGLRSDVDHLLCRHNIRIIPDWSEWEQGSKGQFLMIQDDTTSPGYCLLQLVRNDEPLPEQYYSNEHYERDGHLSTDTRGRVLLRHSYSLSTMGNRHGPASTFESVANRYNADYVSAYHCSAWPKEANSWLQKRNMCGWPTEDIKRYSSEQGCFVVPVGSRTGMHQNTEWRISTSWAERCLMFSLNITQIRCYILTKMLLKTFIKPKCGEAVSSFMCKTILFHCISSSASSSSWNDCRLLTCLSQCLQALFKCILTEKCPHFIIHGNNLLAGKLTTQVKHQLVQIMTALTSNLEHALLGVQVDDLGVRLYAKSGHMPQVYIQSAFDIATVTAVNNVIILAHHLLITIGIIQKKCPQDSHILTSRVSKLCQIYLGCNPLYKVATTLFTPFLCSIIGSRKASADIQHSQVLSPEALTWLSFGENSDISSGKLKLASALYCSGDLQRCGSILAALREQLHTTVKTFCCCYNTCTCITFSEDFRQICYETNEDSEVIKHNMAFCVKYLPCEVNCIPNEMKYEMFRSTAEDLNYRGERDLWMDWAVVDSQPYLYFLQYKVYSQLQRPADQQSALEDLARTIDTDPNLGHRETALNLLGQCMEQENKNQDALKCYMKSLRVKGRNNAAKWLICCLLARLFSDRLD